MAKHSEKSLHINMPPPPLAAAEPLPMKGGDGSYSYAKNSGSQVYMSYLTVTYMSSLLQLLCVIVFIRNHEMSYILINSFPLIYATARSQ